MKYREMLLKIYRKHACFINKIPFINKIKNKGNENSFQLNKPMVHSKIICNGNNNKIFLMPGGGLDHCTFLISGNNNTIIIGDRASAVRATICVEDSGNVVHIGDKSSLCGEILLAACEGTKIEIGEDMLASSHIEIRTSDSHAIYNDKGERINAAKDIYIGKHVWIGTGVKINKGVSIGNGCIVGNGAIVTRKFENSNVIIAGNPANIVKEKIKWSKDR